MYRKEEFIMINAKQLRELIIRPTLQYLDPIVPYSENAVELLMMTAAHESHLGTYIAQVKGPALGIYQMEPATQEDIYNNFLMYRSDLADLVMNQTGGLTGGLIGDLFYATSMARVHYFRAPEALPTTHLGMADYAKKYYNTKLGKALPSDYLKAYKELC